MDREQQTSDGYSARLHASDVAGEATFSGCLSVANVDPGSVGALLPRGVSLLASRRDAACSCLLAFGEHSDGRTFFGGFQTPWGVRYHELMFAIPFVTLHGAGPYLYLRGMACDFWPAAWNGNVYYGFMKQFARIEWDGRRFASRSAGERQDFLASVTAPSSLPRSPETVRWLHDVVAQRVLGCRADGTFVESRFEWSFDDSNLTAVDVEVRESLQFPELHALAPFRAVASYAVQRMRWRLSWPTPCDPRAASA